MSLKTSILTGGSNSHETTSEEANSLGTDILSEGFTGALANTGGVAPATGSFACNAQGSPDMTVAVSAGVCYTTATPSGGASQLLRTINSASANVTIAANATGGTRYDWIYVSVSAANAANPNAAGTNVSTLVASRSTSATTDDGTPPTYGTLIAIVTVANGAGSISNGSIADRRTQVGLQYVDLNTTDDGWNTGLIAPSSVTCNGNRSYSVVFPSVDYTSVLSPGMRLKLTRTVTAPTKCTDLESGSSQYYSKTSPAGMTFTDDFVVSAWVKMESYATMTIASRYNGTSGWTFRIKSTGQVSLYGFNAGAANFSGFDSYQSIPLGKWVHITAQLDMSAFTATTTTSYVMIDGVDVPIAVGRGGTNPTALIQAGDLQIGSENTGAYWDGKLAQVAIYSAKVTQANIRATMSQGLSGSETSLVSAYSFNNSINDLNANANNLTAQGSAVATSPDSPFALDAQGVPVGTTEYAIITKTAFSTNTTVTVQVPEGGAIPTSGGVSAVSYSPVDTPYGFPRSKAKWVIESAYVASVSQATSATTSYNNQSAKLTVPIGAFRLGYQGNLYLSDTASSTDQASTNLSYTAANLTPVTGKLTSNSFISTTGSTVSAYMAQIKAEDYVNHTAELAVYANIYTSQALDAAYWYSPAAAQVGGRGLTISAELAYV